MKLIVRRQREGRLVAGWGAIARTLHTSRGRADRFVLFGSYHDAGGQLAAFTRLMGPLGRVAGEPSPRPRRGSHLVVEQLDAEGRWRGVEAAAQRGDSELLARYLRQGGQGALAALGRRQRAINYTAWKYRYVPTVLQLVLAARASRQPLSACDMSRGLQEHLRSKVSAEQLLRLRELHCWLALAPKLTSPATVAMFWGQDHIGPHGFQRFVPAKAEVWALYLYGHRPGRVGLEVTLAPKLALASPILLPLEAMGPRYRAFALLLPGPRLGVASWHQRRDGKASSKHSAASQRRLRARSAAAGELWVGRRRLVLKPDVERSICLPAPSGEVPVFVFRGRRGALLVGSLELWARGGELTLALDPRKRSADALVQISRKDSYGRQL